MLDPCLLSGSCVKPSSTSEAPSSVLYTPSMSVSFGTYEATVSS